jgi:Flp pilus assembly protein TadD
MATTVEVDDATALAVGALVIGLLAHDTDAALNAIERALSVNPSSSSACYLGSYLYALRGHSVTGTTYAFRALRLSPFDPLAYHAHLALTLPAIQEEHYDEAAAHGAKLAQTSPNLGAHVMVYAVALALAGRMDEARQASARALEIEPSISIRTTRSVGLGPRLAENYERGLRMLGVPE